MLESTNPTHSTSLCTNILNGLFTVFSILFNPFLRILPMSHNRVETNISKQAALTEIRAIRDGGLRDSDRIIELWTSCLSHYIHKLGHEKWNILEQVFIAALDVGNETLACNCLDQLGAKFPKSSRVTRLFAMYLESKGSFEAAEKLYTQLINEDGTNILARKRLVALLKAQQKIPDAISNLNQYLKIFMSDFEAWSELADLYLSEGDYKHAAFCMEELILSNPSNHLYYQRYAEIKYTEGGLENLELARVYYARACYLCPNNLRTLFGLLLTCSALDNQVGKSRNLLSLSGPTFDANSSTVSDDKHKFTNGPVSYKISSNCSMNVNSQLKHKNFNTLPLSATERNRRLAQWAMKRICSIYEASRHPIPVHINSTDQLSERLFFSNTCNTNEEFPSAIAVVDHHPKLLNSDLSSSSSERDFVATVDSPDIEDGDDGDIDEDDGDDEGYDVYDDNQKRNKS